MQDTQTDAGIRSQTHNDIIWLDVENPNQVVLERLEREYSLHPVHLNECMQNVQHAQVEHEDDYLFLILHVPIQTARKDKIHVTQVGVFLGKKYLVTVRSGPSPCITDMFEASNLSSTKAEAYFGRGSAYLLHRLINKLLSDISEMTDDVNSELDQIEDLVFDNNDSDRQRIGRLRQKIVRLSRLIGPKRMLLQDLADQIDSFTGESMAKYYFNNMKLVNKLWEEIDEAKETVEVYKDADFTASTEQTNRILAILTLVFTFTIPVTVVGTLYGMNILLPGSVNGTPWTFLGRYTTFGILVAVSALAAATMYWYFKKKKWF